MTGEASAAGEGEATAEVPTPQEVVSKTTTVEASVPSEVVATPATQPDPTTVSEPVPAAPAERPGYPEPARGEPVEPVEVATPPERTRDERLERPPTPTPPNIVQELLIKARAAIQARRQQKMEKIVAHVNEKGKIANDEVEKLLRVSDSTATRYLLTLAKDGRLKRVGSRGRAVFYAKN